MTAVTAAVLPWTPLAGRGRTDGTGLPPEGTGSAAADPAGTAPRDEAAAFAEALRTGTDVLVETATSATSLLYAQPDGKLRAVIHATPQRARRDDGQWAAIDTRLERVPATDGLGVQPLNVPAEIRLSTGSEVDAARTDGTVLAEGVSDGHTVSLVWPGPLPSPVLDGSRALYPEVFPGVDLLVVVSPDSSVGQVLVVKDRRAAANPQLASLSYRLESDSAVFERDPVTEGVHVLDPATGDEISSVRSPLAWDSGGRTPGDGPARTGAGSTGQVLRLSGLAGIDPGARSAALRTRLDGAGTGNAVLHLDVEGTGLLSDPDAIYPLFIDPEVDWGKNEKEDWTLVSKRHPNSNFFNGTNYAGGTSQARVGYESDTGVTARSFWNMQFGSSITGAEVASATFHINNVHSWSCSPRKFLLHRTDRVNSATTWNNQPDVHGLQDTASFAYGHPSCTEAGDYVKFDVQAAVQWAANNGKKSITLRMKADDETDTTYWRKFNATSAYLHVIYNRAPEEPTGGKSEPGGACVVGGKGVTVAKTKIVLSATARDADKNMKGMRFRFWKTGDTVPAGELGQMSLVSTTANGTGVYRATLGIPSSRLADATTYSWDVRAEDDDAASTYFPPGTTPCRLTVDASKPPAPTVSSDVFLEATDDGATWSTVKFGERGAVTFTAEDAAEFTYNFEGIDTRTVPATNGTATVATLAPRHAGPNYLHVYAYDAVGNRSERTIYGFYVPPRDAGDEPGDVGGDGMPDLMTIGGDGTLRTYPGDEGGELYKSLVASYDSRGTLSPDRAEHFWDADTGKTALITKYADAYPGDGLTDLWVRTPGGGFYLYPGDGYGSFNVDDRLPVILPEGTPDPATWTRIKAVGDITGDELPDLVVQAGTAFWTLSGYTGASFSEATLMEGSAWAFDQREIVSVADVDLDGTPDLLWRSLTSGKLYVRHGKPGSAADSVDLASLKYGSTSRDGDVTYATGWTTDAVTDVLATPDVNDDGILDLWTRSATDGTIRVHHGTTTAAGAADTVISSDWSAVKAFG